MVYCTRQLLFILLILFLFPVEGVAEFPLKQQNKTLLNLQDAIAEALQHHPGLAKEASNAKALSQSPPQASAMPDPQLMFNISNLPTDSFDTDREAMTQFQIGLIQGFPFPGKLALKEKAARHQAQAADAAFQEMRLNIIQRVKTRWWSMFQVERALNILIQNKTLLMQFVEIAQTKYKVGKGLQQDVLLAQLELSKLLDVEIGLKAKRRRAEAALNALLNRPTGGSIRLPETVSEMLPSTPDEKVLLQTFKNARPVLVEIKMNIAVARTRLDLAKKGYAPDFKLGAVYGHRRGENPNGTDRADFASLLFSMNLPVYGKNKQSKAIDQRSNELTTERLALLEKQNEIAAEISQALASYRQLREQSDLFKRGIIPQATQTVASMLAGYQVNKVDFLNLVRAQLTLYNYEIQYWKTFSQAQISLVQLAHAVGKEDLNAN